MPDYTYGKLHPWSFGLAIGIIWGISLLITGLVAMATGFGQGFVDTARTVYIGYTSTVMGSIIGAIWAFVDFFIFGVIIAALYNLCLSWFRRKTSQIDDETIEKKRRVKTKPKNFDE